MSLETLVTLNIGTSGSEKRRSLAVPVDSAMDHFGRGANAETWFAEQIIADSARPNESRRAGEPESYVKR
jgi:hypothetical protein